MIRLARPTVSPVVNIVFAWNLFSFARFWKVEVDGQHVRKQWSLPAVTVGRPSGSICPLFSFICESTYRSDNLRVLETTYKKEKNRVSTNKNERNFCWHFHN